MIRDINVSFNTYVIHDDGVVDATRCRGGRFQGGQGAEAAGCSDRSRCARRARSIPKRPTCRSRGARFFRHGTARKPWPAPRTSRMRSSVRSRPGCVTVPAVQVCCFLPRYRRSSPLFTASTIASSPIRPRSTGGAPFSGGIVPASASAGARSMRERRHSAN